MKSKLYYTCHPDTVSQNICITNFQFTFVSPVKVIMAMHIHVILSLDYNKHNFQYSDCLHIIQRSCVYRLRPKNTT